MYVTVYGHPIPRRIFRLDREKIEDDIKLNSRLYPSVERQVERIVRSREKQVQDLRFAMLDALLNHETATCKIVCKRLGRNIRTLERWLLSDEEVHLRDLSDLFVALDYKLEFSLEEY